MEKYSQFPHLFKADKIMEEIKFQKIKSKKKLIEQKREVNELKNRKLQIKKHFGRNAIHHNSTWFE